MSNNNCVHARLASRLLKGLETMNEILDPDKDIPAEKCVDLLRLTLNVVLAGTVDLAVEVIGAEVQAELERRGVNLESETEPESA